ncbi:MAG: PEP-CTERM sorting domain-containing protein [Pseudomonadota bacterium]
MNRSRLISLLFLSFSLAAVIPARALPLTPMVGGVFTNGDGANSRWVQVVDDWRGSLYGDAPWGTGIWGLADHAAVMALGNGDTGVVQTLDTRVDQINFADQHFIDAWGTTWASPRLAPIFGGAGGQNNWAARFWGYLAITEPGAYNFGILYDDGFRFTLFGADGAAQRIEVDGLNPRDRLGFAEDLLLSPGLYAYQLDAYDRLEAGAVQLAWSTPGERGWSVVPQAALFTRAIPEPPLPLLLLAGLIAAGFATRRR